MKVLLIQPRRWGIGFKDLIVVEPLGLEMIAGALEGHEVKILDMVTPDEIIKEVYEFDPDMCGISCSFTVDYENTLLIAKKIKEKIGNVFVFVGGHHAATNPHHFADKDVDAVVVGEGEVTARELVEAYGSLRDLSKVGGIVLNEGKDVESQICTEERPLIQDLDTLPYPRRDLVAQYRDQYYLGLKRPAYALETARGCPYKCKFCSVWRFYKSSYRMKSAERVFEEIVNLPGDNILVTDDNFFSNIQRAYKIGEMLKEAGVNKYFSIQARSDDIVYNLDLIDLWREVGLATIFIGFEQIDQEGLNDLNKRNTIKNNEEALIALKERGLGVTASFIVKPTYDEKDFEVMYNYIKEKGIMTPSYSILTPLPGTVLYEEEKERILTEDYCLYDFLHAVMPTKMPLDKFYKEFAKLWKKTYKGNLSKLTFESITELLKSPPNLIHSVKLLRGMRRFFSAKSYLKSHESCQFRLYSS